MAWVVAALAIVLLAIGMFTLRRGFTYYHPAGFTSYGPGGDGLQPVSRDRYERILARFLVGDLIDGLWLSHLDDPNGGLTLTLEDGEVEVDVHFLPLKEPERIAAFRTQMAAWGHTPSDESTGNVGLGPDMETLSLEFRLPKDEASLRVLVDGILTFLQGPMGASMFVAGWQMNLPATSYAVRLHSNRDPLSQIP